MSIFLSLRPFEMNSHIGNESTAFDTLVRTLYNDVVHFDFLSYILTFLSIYSLHNEEFMNDQNNEPPISPGNSAPDAITPQSDYTHSPVSPDQSIAPPQPVVPPLPGLQYGGQPGSPGGFGQNPPPSIGMVYNPAVPQGPRLAAPSAGLRFVRGVGWGALFGQWWTLWTIASQLLWHGMDKSTSTSVLVIIFLIYAAAYAFFGAVAGLIIAGISADPARGAVVGIVVGLCVMGLEALIMGGLGSLINIFFYFITGRYVGSNIAARVGRPVKI